ncbi:MAG: hypothetical protein FWG15_03555 [Propionibacteriaceae bacterium]|nr:hypothetical protein [Propionibacteriaceae bacterium]
MKQFGAAMATLGFAVACLSTLLWGVDGPWANADPDPDPTATETTTAPPSPPPPPKKTATALSLSVSPSSTPAGGSLTVSGTLTAGGKAVKSASVSLSISYGQITSNAYTDSKGAFTATGFIPIDDGFPASFTVTASYGGDGVYTGSQATAKGSIQAAAQLPTVDTSDPSVEPTTVQTYVVRTDVGPVDGTYTAPSASSSAGATKGSSKHVMLIEIVFLVVAFVAIAVLLVVGIVSHGTKSLTGGERRGFGSDFGKDGTPPVKEIPSA